MSFFILDPAKNTVADSIIPTGSSASTASILIPTTVIIDTIHTPNPIVETYINLADTNIAYSILSTDNTIEVVSATYLNLTLPTSLNNPNKKFIIMRSFGGNGILTINSYSINETIEGFLYIEMTHNGDLVKLISDGEGNWRTY